MNKIYNHLALLVVLLMMLGCGLVLAHAWNTNKVVAITAIISWLFYVFMDIIKGKTK